MIALSLTEVKECMSKLLLTELFDPFLFLEGEIVTFSTFHIDGFLKKNFYDSDSIPPREYALWKEVREYCYSLIKGKRTPLHFHFIFGLSPSNITKLLQQKGLTYQPQDVKGLFLNIKFDGTHLQCTTGISMNLFTLDKSLEQAWDEMVQKFFLQKSIPFELLS